MTTEGSVEMEIFLLMVKRSELSDIIYIGQVQLVTFATELIHER